MSGLLGQSNTGPKRGGVDDAAAVFSPPNTRLSQSSLESLFYDLNKPGVQAKRAHQWTVEESCNEFVGARRSKHTIVSWGNAIFVFGGDDGRKMLNDLLRFDLLDNSWGRVVTKHHTPAPRYHHSAVVYGDSMFIFGGYTGDLNSPAILRNLNDLFEFRFTTSQWIEWDENGPVSLPSHLHVTSSTSFWQHQQAGGAGAGVGAAAANQPQQQQQQQQQLQQQVQLQQLQVPLPQAHHDAHAGLGVSHRPPVRSAHGAAVYDSKMWIFAGYDGNKRLNDMWMIPLESSSADVVVKWTEVQQSGTHPPTCCNFPVAVLGDSMFVFSGQSGAHITNHLFQFRFPERRWVRVITQQLLPGTCAPPARRYGHSMVAHEKNNMLYVFGGCTADNLSQDLHCFDLQTCSWSVIPAAAGSQVPIGRVFHSAAVVGDAMYVFGGTGADNTRHSDMYRFQFDTHPRSSLQDDFLHLLQSGELFDVFFLVGGADGKAAQRIGAHSAVLSARSSVLRARILQASEKLRAEGAAGASADGERPLVEVSMPDFTPEVFRIALVFMYSDRLVPRAHTLGHLTTSEMGLLMDVYKLATELRLALLERLTASLIEGSVDRTNVIFALNCAHAHNLSFAKEYCLRYVTKEANYREIVMSPAFESLDRPLMVEIIRRQQAASGSSRAPSPDSADISPSHSAGPAHCGTLVTDLNQLLESKPDCAFFDITVSCGDVSLPAHRAVLAARSGFFAALFRNSPPDLTDISAAIGDIMLTKSVLKALLRFIYHDDVDMQPELALYLFSAPHYFSFSNSRLQSFCRESLETSISAANVLAVLESADKIKAAEMKRHALSIISTEFANVVRLDALRRLEKPLLLDILEALGETRF